LGQYIGLVLIPRINHADSYFQAGSYIEAVEKQKSVIRALYRGLEAGEDELKAWIKRIDDISKESNKLTGLTNELQRNNRYMHYSKKAKGLYEDIDWEIWGKLHKFGYFSGKKMYGPRIENVDMEDAVEI